jgi:hypothetical protein
MKKKFALNLCSLLFYVIPLMSVRVHAYNPCLLLHSVRRFRCDDQASLLYTDAHS